MRSCTRAAGLMILLCTTVTVNGFALYETSGLHQPRTHAQEPTAVSHRPAHPSESTPRWNQQTARSGAAVPPTDAPIDATASAAAATATSACFTMVLEYPFEQVMETWEGGPPDTNFIREEVEEQTVGAELRRQKTIFTKNPLPWVLKQMIVRDEVFVFGEQQRVNLQARYSVSTSFNKILQCFGTIHREASMKAHPENPNWTEFTQTLTANFTDKYGGTVKETMEHFTSKLFVKSARRGTDILQTTLKQQCRAAAVDPGAGSAALCLPDVYTTSSQLCRAAMGWSWWPAAAEPPAVDDADEAVGNDSAVGAGGAEGGGRGHRPPMGSRGFLHEKILQVLFRHVRAMAAFQVVCGIVWQRRQADKLAAGTLENKLVGVREATPDLGTRVRRGVLSWQGAQQDLAASAAFAG